MKFIIILLAFVHFQSSALDSTSKPEEFCGLIGMYAVSPSGELEKFLFVGPPKCSDETIKVNIAKDWLVTACAYFTTQKHEPTYQVGDKLNWSHSIFYYLPAKPNLVYPNKDAGSGLDNPVIYVKESGLETDNIKDEICNGIMYKR